MPACKDRWTYPESLLRYDELEGEERRVFDAHLAECPACRRRITGLREAEASLRRGVRAIIDCPPVETLYDFGGGPGAEALTARQRMNVQAHVHLCKECAEQVTKVRRAASDAFQRSGAFPPHLLPDGRWQTFRRVASSRRVAVAAAACLVVAVGIYFLQPSPPAPPQGAQWRAEPSFVYPPTAGSGEAALLPVLVPAFAWTGADEEVEVTIRASSSGAGIPLWSARTRERFVVPARDEFRLRPGEWYEARISWRVGQPDERYRTLRFQVDERAEETLAGLRSLRADDALAAKILAEKRFFPDALLAALRAAGAGGGRVEREARSLAGRIGIPWSEETRDLLARLAAAAAPK